MAKKKANKSKKKAAGSPEPAQPERKAAARYLAELDGALERGSYAGVRMLAARAPADLTEDERDQIEARTSLVDIDPVQVGVGGFAMVAAVIAAIVTLVWS